MRKIALSAATMLLVLATPVFAALSSRYAVSGRNPDKSAFSGAIRFTADGQVYPLVEAGGDNSKMSGLAVENGNYLALAEIGDDGGGALAIYKRAGDAWVGVYSDYADDPLGVEALYNGNAPDLPDPGRATAGKPVGKYRLSGTNPDGSTYAGEVEVKSGKTLFDVDRTAGDEQMTGTLLEFDGALVFNVSKSDGRAPIGVLALLVPEGKGFLGVWVRQGSQKLGAERWVREP